MRDIRRLKLQDGYIFTFDNEGMLGPNHWCVSLRTLVGIRVSVESISEDGPMQVNAIRFAKSINLGLDK